MIKVVLFDLAGLLAADDHPVPGVVEALRVIAQLRTIEGRLIGTAIVANWPVDAGRQGAEEIEKCFRVEILEPSGLDVVFEPFEQKVTISARAGAPLPQREIFVKALERLRSTAKLEECAFLSSDERRLRGVMRHGIVPVGVDVSCPGGESFTHWKDAPLVLAKLIAPDRIDNLGAPAALALPANLGLSGFTPTTVANRVLHGRANQLVQLNDSRLGSLSGVYVERPTEVAVQLASNGTVGAVTVNEPSAEEVEETVNFVRSLVRSGRVGLAEDAQGMTHAVRTDAQGRRRLVRTRFA